MGLHMKAHASRAGPSPSLGSTCCGLSRSKRFEKSDDNMKSILIQGKTMGQRAHVLAKSIKP